MDDEVPDNADGHVAVTEQWLLSVGFFPYRDGVLASPLKNECGGTVVRWLEVWLGGVEWNWAYVRLAQQEDRVSIPTPIKRGDVRQLATALQIDLEETL